MPSETSAVGALELPIPSGEVGQKISDPLIDAILDFASFYIKDALDEKLVNVLPPGLMVDAVPEENRFDFDPLQPRGIQITLPVPSLFVWWQGMSKVFQQTTIHTYRQRQIELMYVFPELPKITEMERRAGLMSSVDAAMHKMSLRQLHNNYGYDGMPKGMGIAQAIAPLNIVSWQYMGGKPGRFGIDEGPLAERRAAKKSGRDYPALKGSFMVYERVQPRTLEDPGDVLHDSNIYISTDGEGTDAELFMEGILSAPDGTEGDE